ncbi:oligopeptide transport ATP-binding protein AppF [Treponema primitia ZAS-2]|uniref:Oligopeptide transport ATP-binding protein AppF n=1 Tax=Treponema primitia (strain ATCC BAA-887 / DSM 12427 / ZAS-2) TaxID=545694 RepID=F5YI66_TREPZ|nr:oligopeptide/dipeptide ABC transporter ATP-binding protein [Treponema primitia]AEF83896.1 oligopeptide transport ATP-binding protein AppF [Treponema primitia ZAS-2]
MAEEILRVSHLSKRFRQAGSPPVQAVSDVSFSVNAGETFGIVGESGCGKSTTGRLLLRLFEPSGGDVFFEGKNILTYNKKEMLEFRKKTQMIFQDPFASLNPRMTIRDIIAEPLICCTDMATDERQQRVEELLNLVGLDLGYENRYPHEFSGGQRQRICIARALVLNPKLVICDEAVSALDVSIQSQILNLLRELQQRMGLTYIFISHNLSVVKHISDRIGVMYLGRLVELAGKHTLFDNPLHPYSQALLSAIPEPNPARDKNRIILTGDISSSYYPPSGCPFHTRCFKKLPEGYGNSSICDTLSPSWNAVTPEHTVACHHYQPPES